MTAMNYFITFVNHASVIFSHKNIRLMTDPWIFGNAFNNGWNLLSESKFTIEDFDKITHIWFSHEHPDHFHPLVLKTIPENFRKKITVLFQYTLDHRVAKKCKELKFKQIIEMKPDELVKLDNEFEIKCVPNGTYDSWFYAKINGKKILNINDCMVDSVSQANIIKNIVDSVDILLTQFGYASWVGDPDDVELRKNASAEKLHRIQVQAKIFQPKFIIPFASFVRFSHIDNSYMNDQMNKIRNVESFILDNTDSIPIILYPGDNWSGDKKIDNSIIEKYLCFRIHKVALSTLNNEVRFLHQIRNQVHNFLENLLL